MSTDLSESDAVSPSQDLGNTDVMNDFERVRGAQHGAQIDEIARVRHCLHRIWFHKFGHRMGSATRCNSLKMAFVSQDAADNVKLHIPTYRYALPGLPYDEHDEPECHTDSKHQASSEQVRQYAAKIANRVVSAHFVEEVLRVALEGKLKKVSYMPRDVEHAAHILLPACGAGHWL